VDAETIPLAAGAGATVFVAGTAVFGAKAGPAAAVKELGRLAAAAKAG
jgi:ribulose-phosphate 3-epimerase